MSDVSLHLSESGVVEVEISMFMFGTLRERFYPLCADAVETEFETYENLAREAATVRPDTYTRRAVFESEQ